jgi:photosystem II stability/assembly factor-like uncharacterized protein
MLIRPFVALVLCALSAPLAAQPEPERLPLWGGTVSEIHHAAGGAVLAFATGREFVGVDNVLFRSTDGGRTWTRVAFGPGARLGRLAVSSDGDAYVVEERDGGAVVHRSTDGGATWTARPAPAGLDDGFPPLGALAADADGRVFAFAERAPGDDGQVWSSADGGATWAASPFPALFFSPVAAAGRLLALDQETGSVQVSGDGGMTWTPIAVGPGRGTFLRQGPDGAVYAAFEDTDPNGWPTSTSAYRSTDGGGTWTDLEPDRPFRRVNWVGCLTDETCWVLSGQTAARFVPGGEVEFAVDLGPLAYPLGLLAVGGRLLAADLGGRGVLASEDDGATWTPSNVGIDKVHVRDVAVAGGALWALTSRWDHDADVYGDDRLWRSASGAAWAEVAPPSGRVEGDYDDLAAFNGELYLSDQGTVFATADGEAWRRGTYGADGSPHARTFLGTPARLFADGFDGLFVSVDGSDWAPFPFPPPDIRFRDEVSDVAVVDGAVLVSALASSHDPEEGRGLWRSEDEGQTWARALDDPARPSVGPLAVLPGGTVLAGSPRTGRRHPGSLYRSVDGGRTFAAVSGLDDVRALAVGAGAVLAGTGRAVHRSTDGGASWSALPGIDAEVRSLALDAEGRLLVATADGLFRVDVRVTSAERAAGPGGLALRIGPSPVRRAATLYLNLPAPARVGADVHDVLGRRVLAVPAARMSAGPQEVRWSAEGLAPGVYVVRVRAGSAVAAAPVTVVR